MLILRPDCHIHADLQNIGSQLLFHLGYAVCLVWIQEIWGAITTKQVIKINKNSGSWWPSDYIIVYMKGLPLSHFRCENRGIACIWGKKVSFPSGLGAFSTFLSFVSWSYSNCTYSFYTILGIHSHKLWWFFVVCLLRKMKESNIKVL